ncbi:unnamed protein product [Symbiodinium pilosum]|uniref:EF-hand domain-containing protein n=1 Tax=Symbiodinium pilosum TaxID=2952 RepID=A0A812VRW3_SYMPI|nr:unnamed protein product [Symbiodinium pilosum]
MATTDRLISLFRQLDRNGNGVIERKELGRVLEALDPISWTDERIDQLLIEADTNVDGKIQYGEFVRWLFTDGSDQAAFCRSVKDISKGLRFQVEALVGLRELCSVPEKERNEALELVLSVLERIVEELRRLKQKGWDLSEVDPPDELPADLPPMVDLPSCVRDLVQKLQSLPAMDKRTMGGKCIPQTLGMEDFIMDQVGAKQLTGKYFVQGVKAFELQTPLKSMPPDKEFVYHGLGQDGRPCSFKVSVAEILEWQSSFRAYYASDVYVGDEGLELLSRSLEGLSEAGEEAWKMKFAIRCSKNPVIMRFDGRVVPREVGDPVSSRIHLVSVCGIDFASRVHDHVDLTHYIKNWKEVYCFDDEGVPYVRHGRDFELSGTFAQLNVSKTLFDLKKMCRLRLKAQDDLGIQVVVEVGLGLGVFAGDAIGIGNTESFKNIQLVVLSLHRGMHIKWPIFRKGDNYEFYEKVFSRDKEPYTGAIPVILMDQDMHAIALAAAGAGFLVGELNPADSHGVFGEYWQNFGPGTEEKLALTTCGLLTQHHAVNPLVMDKKSYVQVSAAEPPKSEPK